MARIWGQISNGHMIISPKRLEITLSIWYAFSSGAQALSIGKGYGALRGRIREKSVSKFDVDLSPTKMVGHDSSHHLKIFGEVSKPISALHCFTIFVCPSFRPSVYRHVMVL